MPDFYRLLHSDGSGDNVARTAWIKTMDAYPMLGVWYNGWTVNHRIDGLLS